MEVWLTIFITLYFFAGIALSKAFRAKWNWGDNPGELLAIPLWPGFAIFYLTDN